MAEPRDNAGMPSQPWTSGGAYFDGVADLYDARRPGFPAELFEEIAAHAALTSSSTVLEVGAGTGQATVRLAELGVSVIALEPGPALAELAARRVASFDKVEVVPSRFEDWDPGGRRFDLLVAASCWHWLDPELRWRKAHDVLAESGWLGLLAHVVVREPGTPEVYAETSDLHEAHHPGHPGWGDPQIATDIIAEADRAAGSIADVERVIGRAPDPSSTDELFDPPLLLWRRQEQHFDARGYVELMRTMSLYGSLDDNVREPLLTAMEQRIRGHMQDHAVRNYLISARVARRRA
jgi:SAM-dependent methyltransferase